MITSKERAKLMSISMTEKATEHLGKDGLTKNFLAQVETALLKRELVKIKVLPNSMLTPKEVMENLCLVCHCEPVKVVGRMVIIYKYSNNEKVKHLLEK